MGVDYKVRSLYNVAIEEVAKNQDTWRTVLQLAGQLYRYEFDNIVMVFAQRPHATLVADYDTWKKVDRYVKRGSKGIAIFPSIRQAAVVSGRSVNLYFGKGLYQRVPISASAKLCCVIQRSVVFTALIL